MYGLNWDRAAEQAQPKHKVGQRVRFTDAVMPTWWFKAGEIGVVTETWGGDYEVETGANDATAYVSDEHLQPAFLPGDRVRVTKHSGYFAVGDTGEVERQTDTAVFVKHGPYQRIGLPIDADALELIAEPEAGNNAQPKFKAGDVVRSKRHPTTRYTIANLKTEYGPGDPYEGDTAYDYANVQGWDREDDIELAPLADKDEWGISVDTSGYVTGISFAQPGPCIVARVLDGTPRPSNVPFVHASVAGATVEAERLAKNNPGQEFAVYQRVAGRVAEVEYSMREVA